MNTQFNKQTQNNDINEIRNTVFSQRKMYKTQVNFSELSTSGREKLNEHDEQQCVSVTRVASENNFELVDMALCKALSYSPDPEVQLQIKHAVISSGVEQIQRISHDITTATSQSARTTNTDSVVVITLAQPSPLLCPTGDCNLHVGEMIWDAEFETAQRAWQDYINSATKLTSASTMTTTSTITSTMARGIAATTVSYSLPHHLQQQMMAYHTGTNLPSHISSCQQGQVLQHTENSSTLQTTLQLILDKIAASKRETAAL